MTTHTAILPDDICLIDDLYLGAPHTIATYLLVGDEPALVDPGPTSALPGLEAGLAAHGLALEDIRTLLLTHIHLDHAGATGTIAARNPLVRVYVHQRGAPHMIAPDKLLRSAQRLYGDAMDYLWGEMRGVSQAQVIPLSGGEMLRLGQRQLRVFDAPGHASHHLLYLDDAHGAAFIGDNGGMRLPGMTQALPTTPPPDIDIEIWQQTLIQLLGLDPQLLLLTHFGPVFDVEAHVAAYQQCLVDWADAVRAGLERGEDEATGKAHLQALAEQSLPPGASEEYKMAFGRGNPVDLAWEGLARYWRKRKTSPDT